jgi:hypothetical protein
MKTIYLFLVALFLFANVQSQELPKKSRVCFGMGISFGFFDPQDINSYIKSDLPSSYVNEFGTTDLFMNYGLNATLGLKIYKFWEFQWNFEGFMAIKTIYITTSSTTYFYDFWRVSTGPMVNFHIPLNAIGKHSIYFGAGPILHYMTFKEYGAVTVGPRFQVGFSMNNYKFNPQVYLAADYASADDSGFNLNYSSIRIGCNVNF